MSILINHNNFDFRHRHLHQLTATLIKPNKHHTNTYISRPSTTDHLNDLYGAEIIFCQQLATKECVTRRPMHEYNGLLAA